MLSDIFTYVGVNKEGNSILFNNLDDVSYFGVVSYFEIPPGIEAQDDKILKSDGVSKIWFEDYPKPEPIPEDPTQKLLEAKIQALADQNEFLEDCIAEMAAEVYK